MIEEPDFWTHYNTEIVSKIGNYARGFVKIPGLVYGENITIFFDKKIFMINNHLYPKRYFRSQLQLVKTIYAYHENHSYIRETLSCIFMYLPNKNEKQPKESGRQARSRYARVNNFPGRIKSPRQKIISLKNLCPEYLSALGKESRLKGEQGEHKISELFQSFNFTLVGRNITYEKFNEYIQEHPDENCYAEQVSYVISDTKNSGTKNTDVEDRGVKKYRYEKYGEKKIADFMLYDSNTGDFRTVEVRNNNSRDIRGVAENKELYDKLNDFYQYNHYLVFLGRQSSYFRNMFPNTSNVQACGYTGFKSVLENIHNLQKNNRTINNQQTELDF